MLTGEAIQSLLVTGQCERQGKGRAGAVTHGRGTGVGSEPGRFLLRSVAPGKSGLHVRSEGERIIALEPW